MLVVGLGSWGLGRRGTDGLGTTWVTGREKYGWRHTSQVPGRPKSQDPSPTSSLSEYRSSLRQDLVQCFREIRRGRGEFLTHLLGVLLPALADLFAEQLLEIPLGEAALSLLGIVDH